MGDYNINLLNHYVHPNSALFLDTLYCKSFVPLITRPTRSTGNSHTVIDNIITYNIEALHYSMQGISLADLSDHYPIFSMNWRIQDKKNNLMSWRRSMSFKNGNKFPRFIDETDWADVYHDTIAAFNNFHKKLKWHMIELFQKERWQKLTTLENPG